MISMARKVKYKITRDDVKNSPKIFDYNNNELYHTVRISEDGSETFNGNVSGYMIQNGVFGIPTEEYELWVSAVQEFLNKHAEDVEKGKGFKIKFDILDVDDRGAYTYKEYINGYMVKEETGWGDKFDSEAEEIEWVKAVIKYNKKHGIEMVTDVVQKKVYDIRKMIDSLDSEIPEEMPLEIPLISAALPELSTNPCEFVSDIKRTSENAIATIYGLPDPKETINYNIKVIKNNLNVQLIKLYDSMLSVVKNPANNLLDKFPSSGEYEDEDDVYADDPYQEYWMELGAYYKEIAKRECNSVARFETVLEPKEIFKPSYFQYNASEPPDGGSPLIYSDPDVTVNLDPEYKDLKKQKTRECIQYYLSLHRMSLADIRFNPDNLVEACYKYNYDLPLLLAQLHVESFFGTSERARKTNSMFSVGLYDNGVDAVTYRNQDESIVPYIDLVKRRYLQNGKVSVDQLLRNYVNESGQRYAKDENYEQMLTSIRNKIIAKWKELASWYSNPTESVDYKELTADKGYNRGAQYRPSSMVKQHIIESMRNLWVPLRKAWENYAKNTLNINPTWIITSGYRPVGYSLGNGVKQADNGSAHIYGYAIDVQPEFKDGDDKRRKVLQLGSFIKSFLSQNRHINFDQIIIEFNGSSINTTTSIWVHLGYKRSNNQQRRQYWSQYQNGGNHGPMEII